MYTATQQKVAAYLSWATLISATCLLGWVVWSLLWPVEPLTVEPGSFEVLNAHKTVARGEILIVRVSYCKSSDIIAQMVSSIEQDSSLWLLSADHPGFTVGCHRNSAIGLVTIPSTLPLESTTAAGSGKAVLRVRLDYTVNVLREIVYSFVTDEFTITP
jgi:hypothetical protein